MGTPSGSPAGAGEGFGRTTLARPRRGGFTLVEIMVVILILGSILLLVPANLFSFGARSRLQNSANTIAAAVAAAREQAILDGRPVSLEFAVAKVEGRVVHGHRFVFSSLPAEQSELLLEEDEKREKRQRDDDEEEVLYTDWHPLEDGVEFTGVSEEENRWDSLREEHPYVVTFGPDGTVDKGFAIRVETDHLDVKREFRTMTIMVNPLTTQSSIHDGLVEVPPLLDENEFVK